MEKTLVISTHADAARADREYWFAQTPAARIRHTLILRRMNYGLAAVSARIVRTIEVIDRGSLNSARPASQENCEI